MLYLVTELGDYNHTRRWSDTQANILFPQLFNLLLVQVTSFRLNAYFGYKTLIIFISFIFARMGGTDILSVTGSRCIQRPNELSQVICTWWLWWTRDNITSIRPSSWISNLSLSLRRPTKQCQHIKLHATDIYRNASVNTQQGLVLPNIQLCLYEAIKVHCVCFGTIYLIAPWKLEV